SSPIRPVKGNNPSQPRPSRQLQHGEQGIPTEELHSTHHAKQLHDHRGVHQRHARQEHPQPERIQIRQQPAPRQPVLRLLKVQIDQILQQQPTADPERAAPLGRQNAVRVAQVQRPGAPPHQLVVVWRKVLQELVRAAVEGGAVHELQRPPDLEREVGVPQGAVAVEGGALLQDQPGLGNEAHGPGKGIVSGPAAAAAATGGVSFVPFVVGGEGRHLEGWCVDILVGFVARSGGGSDVG
ncbi:uncharacterized protein BP01DRAFT_398054, partial [Aspergillus saccharolyticus JOP 1030-1]